MKKVEMTVVVAVEVPDETNPEDLVLEGFSARVETLDRPPWVTSVPSVPVPGARIVSHETTACEEV